SGAADEIIRKTGTETKKSSVEAELVKLKTSHPYAYRAHLDIDALLRDVTNFARRLVQQTGTYTIEEYKRALRFVSTLHDAKIYVPDSALAEVAGAFGVRPHGLAAKLGSTVGGITREKSRGVAFDDVARVLGDLIPEGIRGLSDGAEQFAAVIEWQRQVTRSLLDPLGESQRGAIDEVTNLVMTQLFEASEDLENSKLGVKAKDRRDYLSDELKRLKRRREREVKRLGTLASEITAARAREKAATRERAERESLLKILKRLQRVKKAGKPTKELIADLVADIDTAAVRMTGKNVRNLLEQKAFFDRLIEEDPEYVPDPGIMRNIDRLNKRHIADFDMDDVRALLDTLRNLEAEIHNNNRLLAKENARNLAIAAAETQLAIEQSNGLVGPKAVRTFNRLFTSSELSPQSMADMVTGYKDDNPLSQAMKAITNGQIRARQFEQESLGRFDRWINDKEFAKGFRGADARRIEVPDIKDADGEAVYLTPAMLVGLWLQTRNQANMDHIENGGVTIPAWKYYARGDIKEALARGADRVPFTKRDIEAFATRHLTASERAFGEAVMHYFDSETKTAINEVSTILNGFERAEVENYYPIMTDSVWRRQNENSFAVEWTETGAPMTIEQVNPANKGMLKERVAGSKNPVILLDVTDVVKRSARDVGSYIGLAIPYRDYSRLMGYVHGKSGVNIGRTLKHKYSVKTYEYFEDFKKDLAKPRKTGAGTLETPLGELDVQSNAITAALSANVGTAIKQAAGYTMAAGELGWKATLGALGKFGTVDRTLIGKYTPLLWERMLGYSSNLFEYNGGLTQRVPWLMGWLQRLDSAFVAKIWKAAELWVQDNEKALDPGGDAYYRRVAERFNDAVLATQVTGYTATKAGALRSANPLMGVFTLFQGQSKTQFNLLFQSWGNLQARAADYKYENTEENLKRLQAAKKRFADSVGAVAFSGIQFGVLSVLSKLLLRRDDELRDEDDKLSLGAMAKSAGMEAFGTLTGMVTFGSELSDMTFAALGQKKWYDIEMMGTGAINDLYNSASRLQSAMGEDKYGGVKVYAAARAVIEAAGSALGIPTGNLLKNAEAVFRHGLTAVYGEEEGDSIYKLLVADSDAEVKAEVYKAYKSSGYEESAEYRRRLAAAEDRGIDESAVRTYIRGKMKEEPDYIKRYESELAKLGVVADGDGYRMSTRYWAQLDANQQKNAADEAIALAWYRALGTEQSFWYTTNKGGKRELISTLKWTVKAGEEMARLGIRSWGDYIALRRL
ncbi:MAG: hypothetical protein LBC65_03375, partial [Oscillospiraceae bacterium]|nr:hypothetical protein [Oscillospiraceae bacterium]